MVNIQGMLLLDCLKCYNREGVILEAEKNWYAAHYLKASEVSITVYLIVYTLYLQTLCYTFYYSLPSPAFSD